MKILEQNGFKYSREQFEGYKFRTIFKIGIDTDWRNDRRINIYTDNPNKKEVVDTITSVTTHKVKSCSLEHFTTREQDELTAQFIEDTLKDI
jgi:hypothetical protein